MVYADYNATTPLDSEVAAVMSRVMLETWANPSSVHAAGRRARAVLDDARYRLAAGWRCKPSEVIFTGGGTEANNLAILGAARSRANRGRHVVACPFEHPAVLESVKYLERWEDFEVTWVAPERNGVLEVDRVLEAVKAETVLVTVMAANNEIGTVQPVGQVGKACRERGILFHTDAVQTFGKAPFEGVDLFQADLVTMCAHKFHGPKGCGALYARSPLPLRPAQMGGSQENDRRAGTENLAAIVGMVEAFERFVVRPVFEGERLRLWTERIAEAALKIPGVYRQGDAERRLANTVAFAVADTDSMVLLANLDLEGICASSGSACSAGSLEPSHVLAAIGAPEALQNSLVRFSLGRETTERDVERICEVLPGVVERSRLN